MHMKRIHARSAFSLVELSIVLVILGLLTGGILGGQSLIRAAELRSISADQQRYFAAIQAFRDKYMGIPGDLTNATAFWGKDNTRCASQNGTAATPGTCNGNGNGAVDSNYIENYRAWQHLALAGLIEGSYSGYVDSVAGSTPPVIGRDVPASKMSSRYWVLAQFTQLGTINYEVGFSGLPDIRDNYLYFSAVNAAYWNNPMALKPEEAWNIDTKMDDGRPATGKVRGAFINNCADVDSINAQYNLSVQTVNCPLGFIF